MPDSADTAAAPAGSYTTRLAALALVLALLAVSYAYPVRAFFQQRALVADEQAERAALLAAETDLRAQQRRWEDPAYVRAQARDRLGFTMPGEVGLIVVGTEDLAAPEPQTGPVVPTLARTSQWWERLWAGVELAGTPPPEEQTEPDEAGPR